MGSKAGMCFKISRIGPPVSSLFPFCRRPYAVQVLPPPPITTPRTRKRKWAALTSRGEQIGDCRLGFQIQEKSKATKLLKIRGDVRKRTKRSHSCGESRLRAWSLGGHRTSCLPMGQGQDGRAVEFRLLPSAFCLLLSAFSRGVVTSRQAMKSARVRCIFRLVPCNL